MSNKIKELRMKKGLSQKEFVKQFNNFLTQKFNDVSPVTAATMSRWENNKASPQKNDYWVALANFFGVAPAYVAGLDKIFESMNRIVSLEEKKHTNSLNEFISNDWSKLDLISKESVDKFLQISKLVHDDTEVVIDINVFLVFLESCLHGEKKFSDLNDSFKQLKIAVQHYVKNSKSKNK